MTRPESRTDAAVAADWLAAIEAATQAVADVDMDPSKGDHRDYAVAALTAARDVLAHATDANAALRERLRADRASQRGRPPAYLTKDEALAELRHYRRMFPTAAPEVIAVGMFRRADQWEEVQAVDAALAEVLREHPDRPGLL